MTDLVCIGTPLELTRCTDRWGQPVDVWDPPVFGYIKPRDWEFVQRFQTLYADTAARFASYPWPQNIDEAKKHIDSVFKEAHTRFGSYGSIIQLTLLTDPSRGSSNLDYIRVLAFADGSRLLQVYTPEILQKVLPKLIVEAKLLNRNPPQEEEVDVEEV
jgi:hypothetical protein